MKTLTLDGNKFFLGTIAPFQNKYKTRLGTIVKTLYKEAQIEKDRENKNKSSRHRLPITKFVR